MASQPQAALISQFVPIASFVDPLLAAAAAAASGGGGICYYYFYPFNNIYI